MNAGRLVVAATAAVLWTFDVAAADEPYPVSDRRIVALALENDAFADEDRHYTNGLRLGVSLPASRTPASIVRSADVSRLFPTASEYRTVYAIGQSTFTPQEIDSAQPDPQDRPYAGWLYGSVALTGSNGRRMHSLELALGIVGPSSKAGESQRALHSVLDAAEPLGWDSQLEDRPSIALTYQRRWRLLSASLGQLDLGLAPHLGTSVGNMLGYANVGATLRLGQGYGSDFGPPRVPPSVPGSGVIGSPPGGWYVFAGVEARGVWRNRLLEGYGDVDGVDREAVVADTQLGVLISRGHMKIAYTHVLRSDEFETQRRSTAFGALSVSISVR